MMFLWGIIILIVLFFIVAAVGFNKARDEADRDKFNDKDTPYFNQKISSYRDHGQPSPRWAVWLGVLITPILFGLALYFGGK